MISSPLSNRPRLQVMMDIGVHYFWQHKNRQTCTCSLTEEDLAIWRRARLGDARGSVSFMMEYFDLFENG